MNGTYFGGQQWLWVLNWVMLKNTLKQNENFHEKSSKEDAPCLNIPDMQCP